MTSSNESNLMENEGWISCNPELEYQAQQRRRKLLPMAKKKQKVNLSKKEIDDIKKDYQWFKRTTALIRAGNLDQLDGLLKYGSSINKKDKHGRTLLHEAATRNKEDIVLYLLNNGADVLQTTKKGYTPLHVAALEGHTRIVFTLLQEISSHALQKLIDAKTSTTGETAFEIAIGKGFYGIAKILKESGASDDLFPDKIYRKCSGTKEFSESDYDNCVTDSDDYVDEMTKEDFNDLMDLSDEYQRISSLPSSPRRSTEMFSLQTSRALELDQLLTRAEKLYVKMHESVNRLGDCDSKRSTLSLKDGSYILNCARIIVEAFEMYQMQLIKRLDDPNIVILSQALKALEFDKEHSYLERGDEFDSKGKGTRYHRLLTSRDTFEKLTFVVFVDLIKKSTRSFIKSIYTAKIFDAVHRNDISFVSNHYWKVNDNGPPQVTDINGRAPLHVAALKNSEKMVETLLKEGANVRLATATTKSTALHIAAAKGHLPVVKRLLQYNNLSAFVDAETSAKNSTALHAAAKYNHTLIVKTLLANGATYCALDANGKTPADLTTNPNIVDFFKLLNELFGLAREGSGELAGKLKKLQKDSLLAVGNARNGKGRTLIEVAEAKGHTGVAREVKQIVGKMEKIRNRFAKKK